MANSTNAVIDVKVAGAQAASREMDRFGQSIRRASQTQAQMAGAANKANQSFRFMRGGLGQVGHQIQDFTVQLQGGQSFLVAFGQQGSQIASLFGPKGAIIGAFLAVGAAIGTTLFSSLKSTKKMMQEVQATMSSLSSVMSYDAKKSAYELSEEFLRLAERSRDLAEVQLGVKYIDALGAAKTAQDALVKSSDALRRGINQGANQFNVAEVAYATGAKTLGITVEQYVALQKAVIDIENNVEGAAGKFVKLVNEATQGGQVMSKAFYDTLGPIIEQAIAMDEATERAEYLKKAMDNLNKEITASGEDDTKRISNLEKLVKGYEDQAVAIGKTARAVALLKAAELGAGAEELERINRAFDLIEKEEKRKIAVKEVTKAIKVQEKATKDSNKVMQGLADGMADAIINAENMKDAFRGMAQSIIQDMLRIYLRAQVMNMIGAVVGMFGSSNQLAPQGQMQFAGAESGNFALGAPSYSGGGFTGFGARSGGLDGKGGFGAILHPNETVIDHTKGQSMGENIVINLNVSTGVAQTVRAEMMNLLPAITNATKAAVADARMRGGSYSKSLVGA